VVFGFGVEGEGRAGPSAVVAKGIVAVMSVVVSCCDGVSGVVRNIQYL
jgi:hypothetical protein